MAKLGENQQSQHFVSLSDEGKAFVVAYIESAYSVKESSKKCKLAESTCRKFLSESSVRKAIYELQQELDSFDYLNEKWARAKLVELYPKLVGEEEVPHTTNLGEQIEVKKFFPEIAFKVIEYVAPKADRNKKDEGDEDELVQIYIPDNNRGNKDG